MTISEVKDKVSSAANFCNNSKTLEEIDKLEQQVIKSKNELRLLIVELGRAERGISKLVDSYYKESEASKLDHPALHSNNFSNNIIDNGKREVITESAKLLHKQLSEICGANTSESEIMLNIENRSSIHNLLKVEEYLSEEMEEISPRTKLQKFTQEYDKLLERIRKLKMSTSILPSNLEAELRRQVLWIKMCGEDLITKIKNETYRNLQKNM